MILNKQLCLTSVMLISVLFWSSCKKCSDGTGNTYNVNQVDLPYIIPYTDSSKVRFLKNGTDTLTYTSQGLKQTYISQNVPEDGCSHTDRLQQFSLQMKCNEKEYFETQLGGEYGTKVNVKFYGAENFKEITKYDFIKYYPPALNYVVLNTKYDSITLLTTNYKDTLYFKPKFGYIYFKINNNIYQLIK